MGVQSVPSGIINDATNCEQTESEQPNPQEGVVGIENKGQTENAGGYCSNYGHSRFEAS